MDGKRNLKARHSANIIRAPPSHTKELEVAGQMARESCKCMPWNTASADATNEAQQYAIVHLVSEKINVDYCEVCAREVRIHRQTNRYKCIPRCENDRPKDQRSRIWQAMQKDVLVQ